MTVPQRLSFFAQPSNCNLATFGLSTTAIPQGAHSEGGKKAGFFERKVNGKESPDSIVKASMHDCGMGIFLY